MAIRFAQSPTPEAHVSRDPEDRSVPPHDEMAIREKMLDKTLADTYPASDPLSSIPDPSSDSLFLDEVVQPDLDKAA